MCSKDCVCGGIAPMLDSGQLHVFNKRGVFEEKFNINDLMKMTYPELSRLRRRLESAKIQVEWTTYHVRGF